MLQNIVAGHMHKTEDVREYLAHMTQTVYPDAHKPMSRVREKRRNKPGASVVLQRTNCNNGMKPKQRIRFTKFDLFRGMMRRVEA